MRNTKLSIIIKPDHKPPYFIGSQLRGALGYALKKVTCIAANTKCEECFASSNCLYYEFYEEKNSFHKYRFDFKLGLDYYNFDFYLFDDATTKLPYIVAAFHMMLTQNGLGKNRTTFKEFDMYINDQSCIKDGQIRLPKEFINTFTVGKVHRNIRLDFVTPLRIKKENRFIRNGEIELKDIINSIYQRQMKLLGRGHKKFPYKVEGEISKKNLQYKELTRLSNRQKTTMNLGGMVGSMELNGLNEESYNVLKLGVLLGVGKQTVFGNGKIDVIPKES